MESDHWFEITFDLLHSNSTSFYDLHWYQGLPWYQWRSHWPPQEISVFTTHLQAQTPPNQLTPLLAVLFWMFFGIHMKWANNQRCDLYSQDWSLKRWRRWRRRPMEGPRLVPPRPPETARSQTPAETLSKLERWHMNPPEAADGEVPDEIIRHRRGSLSPVIFHLWCHK